MAGRMQGWSTDWLDSPKNGQVDEDRLSYSPSLEQIHIVELVELHRELYGGLDLAHVGGGLQATVAAASGHP